MNEQQYALELKRQYEEAKEELGNVLIFRNLKELEKDYGLNFYALKNEVEKIGYHFELVSKLNDKELEKIVQDKYSCCFFYDEYII